MIPFVLQPSDLYRMLVCVMKRFIKKDIMNDANSAVVLMKIVPLDRNSHKSYSKVDLGFAAEQELCTLKPSRPNAVSEKRDGVEDTVLKLSCNNVS